MFSCSCCGSHTQWLHVWPLFSMSDWPSEQEKWLPEAYLLFSLSFSSSTDGWALELESEHILKVNSIIFCWNCAVYLRILIIERWVLQEDTISVGFVMLSASLLLGYWCVCLLHENNYWHVASEPGMTFRIKRTSIKDANAKIGDRLLWSIILKVSCTPMLLHSERIKKQMRQSLLCSVVAALLSYSFNVHCKIRS